jgi:hypothetical protein
VGKAMTFSIKSAATRLSYKIQPNKEPLALTSPVELLSEEEPVVIFGVVALLLVTGSQ